MGVRHPKSLGHGKAASLQVSRLQGFHRFATIPYRRFHSVSQFKSKHLSFDFALKLFDICTENIARNPPK